MLEDNNPDVVPQETSDGEYISEEKAFDRLKTGGYNKRVLYTPHISTTPSLSPSSTFSSTKQYGELSLTTNPAFALYNSPQRRPPPLYPTPKLQIVGASTALDGRVNSNIYTRIPTRPFSPYDNRQSPASPTAYSSGVTMPLLFQHYQQQGSSAVTLTNTDDNS